MNYYIVHTSLPIDTLINYAYCNVMYFLTMPIAVPILLLYVNLLMYLLL